jgi:phosphatidylserine/phosphatidylglycerophosphate/cardiolipin synthase-like enzyme
MTIPLICCTWTHREILPSVIKSKFQDLDDLIRRLISTSKSQLFIVSPYLSPAGIKSLKNGISLAAKNGSWIRLLTSDLDSEDTLNFKAVKALIDGEEGEIIRGRLRVLTGSKIMPELFHSKLILCDGEKGYLGSANISFSGLEKNFEVGVELQTTQVEALQDLISYIEAQGLIVDVTDKFN